MGIGTSLGAFHEDEFHHVASPWMSMPKEDNVDNNVIDPDVDPKSTQPIKDKVIPIAFFDHVDEFSKADVEDRRSENYVESERPYSEIFTGQMLNAGNRISDFVKDILPYPEPTRLAVDAGIHDIGKKFKEVSQDLEP